MQRTFNYTDRHRLEKADAVFSFRENSTNAPDFDVNFEFNPDDFPPDAALYVEAHFRETRQRFDFGTVGQISPPDNRRLDQIDLSGPTLFRVLIVDHTSGGIILAAGDGFRADTGEDGENQSWLLAVSARPMGQVTWKMEFQTGGMPELTVNNSIPGAIERMRSDPIFQSLILPAALREILIHYLWNNHEENSDIWKQWTEFAELFADPIPDDDDTSVLLDWVDEVVAGFCARFDFSDMLVHSGIGDSE